MSMSLKSVKTAADRIARVAYAARWVSIAAAILAASTYVGGFHPVSGAVLCMALTLSAAMLAAVLEVNHISETAEYYIAAGALMLLARMLAPEPRWMRKAVCGAVTAARTGAYYEPIGGMSVVRTMQWGYGLARLTEKEREHVLTFLRERRFDGLADKLSAEWAKEVSDAD